MLITLAVGIGAVSAGLLLVLAGFYALSVGDAAPLDALRQTANHSSTAAGALALPAGVLLTVAGALLLKHRRGERRQHGKTNPAPTGDMTGTPDD